MYQQVNLSDHSLVGGPGPLPANLVGLPDDAVADVSPAVSPAPLGMVGQGWWPVSTTTPVYDPTQQTPDGTYAYTVNVSAQTVTGVANLRAATSAEASAALGAAQTAKVTSLTLSCAATITGGYLSSALGSAHNYPSNATDQINMLGSVTDSLLPNLPSNWTTWFNCQDPSIAATDANQGWAFRAHTAAQIQGAGADGKTAILNARVKLSQLKAAVMAAKSQSDLNGINW